MTIKNISRQIVIPLFLSVCTLVGTAFYLVKSGKVNLPGQPYQKFCTMEAKQCPDGSYVGRGGPNCEFTACPENNLPGWETYKSEQYGFEFNYPGNLILLTNNNSVTLNHSIPYDNFGDCDMNPDTKLHERLNDFNISFEIKSEKENLTYEDGKYDAGLLKGVWQLEGAEGCGTENYYFSTPDNKTLVVKKDLIQAFSGISTAWDSEKILSIPGVITKEDAEKLFYQILSTFKFTNSNATPTSSEGKFCGGIAGLQCPTGYRCVLDGNYPDAGGKCTKY